MKDCVYKKIQFNRIEFKHDMGTVFSNEKASLTALRVEALWDGRTKTECQSLFHPVAVWLSQNNASLERMEEDVRNLSNILSEIYLSKTIHAIRWTHLGNCLGNDSNFREICPETKFTEFIKIRQKGFDSFREESQRWWKTMS